MVKRCVVLLVLVSGALSGLLRAEDAYFHLPLSDLELTEGTLPSSEVPWRTWWSRRSELVYAVLDGDGEVYIRYDVNARRRGDSDDPAFLREIAVRVPQLRDVTGRIFLPQSEGEGRQAVRFRLLARQAAAEDRERFFETKLDYYERLLRRDLPGAAWFRHQAREARQALGRQPATDSSAVGRPATGSLEGTFALFTGGRAMSENLQLDRVLDPAGDGTRDVALATIDGITVQEIDWRELVAGKSPELDPLASSIPADQHAVFFPTFAAAVTLSDELRKQGATALQLAEPRSTDARTLERYQRQLCLQLTDVARILGPVVVRSVAMTGSDPYFRTGTDVAVLFETDDAATLEKLLLAQVAMAVAEAADSRSTDGTCGGLHYRGVRNESRSICSYLARGERVVIVTNSLYQLERLAQVCEGQTPSLASLDEYKFFRDRYGRRDEGESAFVFLSDATIRRWCGPRWRIGTSRRTRDAAVVAELQASQLDRLVQGAVQEGPLYTDLPLGGGGGTLRLSAEGVQSSSAGSLAFMTPIAELEIEQVTRAEADAYRLWRDRYQNNWRWAFDPIGLRLGVSDGRLSADLTVMPLIWGSDYRELIAYSRGAEFAPDAGDRHNTLAHVLLALNTKSPELQRQTNLLRMMTGDLQVEPLSWLGSNVGLYLDEDPFWQELAQVPSEELNEFLEESGWKVPLAVRAEVSSGMKLALFLGALRAWVEQASPGMLNWETRMYKEQPYVKITPTERAIGSADMVRHLAIYYSASGTSLTVTTNENVLQRALDREVDRRSGRAVDPAAAGDGWVGANLGLQANDGFLRVAAAVVSRSYQRTMQDRAWANLTILNEWKRRYPEQDPVALHERYWQQRLVCPGGGQYVWNESWQTMESTVYGCPAAPHEGPLAPAALTGLKRGNFGLTFEEQGLRARVVLDR